MPCTASDELMGGLPGGPYGDLSNHIGWNENFLTKSKSRWVVMFQDSVFHDKGQSLP